jgi:flagellar basal-body rod protein FlgB
MSMFTSVNQLQGYLELVSDRQQMIVTNMANVDTPGYHTKDVNFQEAMQQVMSQDDAVAGQLQPEVLEQTGLPERPDGNNVDIDREGMKLSQTQLQFQMGEQLVKSDFSTLMTAIKGGQ